MAHSQSIEVERKEVKEGEEVKDVKEADCRSNVAGASGAEAPYRANLNVAVETATHKLETAAHKYCREGID